MIKIESETMKMVKNTQGILIWYIIDYNQEFWCNE